MRYTVQLRNEYTGAPVGSPAEYRTREQAGRAAGRYNRFDRDNTWNRVSAYVEVIREAADTRQA